jgi:hypothetical protein
MASHATVLELRLSPERLAPYRRACDNDLLRAIKLYQWNCAVSAAFWQVLSHLEVLVRNTLHAALRDWTLATHGSTRWYVELAPLFSREAQDQIDTARRRALYGGRRSEEPTRVITELHFGFWRFLLNGRYDRTLWRPCLHKAFPHYSGLRRTAHEVLTRLHDLRNRIAHHEPVHDRDLKALHDDLLTVISWICPVTRDWVEKHSTVPATLSRRPT